MFFADGPNVKECENCKQTGKKAKEAFRWTDEESVITSRKRGDS